MVTAVVLAVRVMVSPVMLVLVVAAALVMLVVPRDHRSVTMTPTAVPVVVFPVGVPVLLVAALGVFLIRLAAPVMATTAAPMSVLVVSPQQVPQDTSDPHRSLLNA